MAKASINFQVVPKFGDKKSVFESVERAQEILAELRQILYTLDTKGVTLEFKEIPPECESGGVEENQD